jgi:hypothetical protein
MSSSPLGKRAFLSHIDSARKRSARSELFTISQREFAKRIRFRDANGYTYAVPFVGDTLYSQYTRTGMIRLVEPLSEKLDSEVPLTTDKVMLYVRKPRTRNLIPLPTGTVLLLDMEKNTLVEARVSIVVSTQMNRPGHIILENLVDTGRVATKENFSGKLT